MLAQLLRELGLAWVVLVGLTAITAHAQNWVPFQPEWRRFTGAVDASALNQPLVAADAISVQGPHFKRVGTDLQPGTSDDRRVRLFGISLSGAAAFPAMDQAKEVAQTLRSLGFNAVRLHSLDVSPTSDPAVFQSTLTQGPYPTLHPGAVERLRHFIQVLGSEGIYVNLSLMVGYQFRPTEDGVPPLDSGGGGPGYGSPAHVFHPAMVSKQVQYARQLMEALGLKGYHGLAQVEVINESSLSTTWMEWDAKKWEQLIQGPYAQELHQQWIAWLRQRHGSEQAACKQWGTRCDAGDLQLVTPRQAQTLLAGSNSPVWQRLKEKFAVWKQQIGGHQHQNSLADLPPKLLDTLQFITDTDRAYLDRMKTLVRGLTRTTLPIAGGQANFGAPLALISQRSMDYVDTHFYVSHPEFPGASWSDTDWRFRDKAMSGGEWLPLVNLTAYRDPNRPFVVSEFNQPYPATWGYEIIPLTAAFAALQDWDALYFFDYALAHDKRVAPHNFNLKGDWPKTIQMGLAARLFRQDSLKPFANLTPFPATDEQMWLTAATLRRPDGWEQQVREVALPKVEAAGLHPALRSRLAFASKTHGESLTSAATGSRPSLDIDGKTWSLELPSDLILMSQGSRRTEYALGPLTLKNTRSDQSTAIWMHALDGQKIEHSRHMLLAIPTAVVGSMPDARPALPVKVVPYQHDPEWKTLEPSSKKNGDRSTSRTATEPLWIKREPRTITLASSSRTFEVYPLSSTGSRLPPLKAPVFQSEPGRHTLQVHTIPTQTHMWFEWIAP